MLQYVRNPITCWAPVHFTGAHVKFMTSYCWVKNTYYVPWSKPIPKYETDYRQMVPYYQWIPFILLAQVRRYQSCPSSVQFPQLNPPHQTTDPTQPSPSSHGKVKTLNL